MKLVKCVNEREGFPQQITVGRLYWMDENTIWKDTDGDEYARFYSNPIPRMEYMIGNLKTSHFAIEGR